jgi:hypothetical protein
MTTIRFRSFSLIVNVSIAAPVATATGVPWGHFYRVEKGTLLKSFDKPALED